MIRNEDFIFGLKLIEKLCHLKFKVVLISSSYAWIFASWHMRTTQIYSSFQKLDLSMQKMFWNQIQTIFLLCIWYWHNIIIELSQPVHSSETDNFKPDAFFASWKSNEIHSFDNFCCELALREKHSNKYIWHKCQLQNQIRKHLCCWKTHISNWIFMKIVKRKCFDCSHYLEMKY